MKKALFYATAAAALAAASGAQAADQDPAVTDAPAGTQIMPKPTMEEDLVYLKDIVALQTLRLDEAEELIEKQNTLIEAQARQLEALAASMSAIGAPALAAAATAAPGAYQVKSGDTLSSIARANNTTIAALAEANNLTSPYPLSVGDMLVIPGAAAMQPRIARAPAPAATPTQKIQQQPQPGAPAPQPVQTAQTTPQPQQPGSGDRLPTEVGVRPEDENERPYLAIFSDVGGILTPKGTLFVEPSVEYTVSSDNRFFFQGIEIFDAILIGAIEATDSNRQALTESIGARYGLTNRIEIDGRISYVSRKDRVTGVAIDSSTASERKLGGYGIGDAEFGIHYQLNNGRNFPYTILNLRAKAPTGDGPFDVERDVNTGIETELAQGSGFWTLEPSLTFILASDPASLYANFGYQKNMSTSPNQVLFDTDTATQTLRTFDPGDALRTSIGVGLSLNERLSLNFGYDQSYFFRSESAFELITREPIFLPDDGDPTTPLVQATDAAGALLFDPAMTSFPRTRTNTATVGSFLFGGSYAVNDRLRINLNGAIGATDEAPDARISLRAQYKLFD